MRNLFLAALAALAWSGPAAAQAPPVRATAAVQPARTILFIGNSFTQGATSAVRDWRAGTVTDLNGGGIGGIPALFKAFADQAGVAWRVAHETHGGTTLGFHYDERRQLFDRAWDVVVLQEYSTLDPRTPGDATGYVRDVGRLARLFRARNPRVQTWLLATWTRADQTYQPGGHWHGRPVTAMADDVRAAADRARAANPGVAGVIPAGQAWNRAIAVGLADANPYDGVAFGQIDLWSHDQYHASIYGSYLEALVVFGRVTGIDPVTLGRGERAADQLGIPPARAEALQRIARDELAAEAARR